MGIRKGISILKIFMGIIYMNIKRRIAIMTKSFEGLILIFKSSKKPTKNRITN